MTWAINWHTNDPAVLNHPLYQRYSTLTFTEVAAASSTIKNELKAMLASRESAALVAYFSWLLRVSALVA